MRVRGQPAARCASAAALTAEQRAGSAPLSGPPAPGGEVQASFERQPARLEPETRGALCARRGRRRLPAARSRSCARRRAEALEPAFAAGFLRLGGDVASIARRSGRRLGARRPTTAARRGSSSVIPLLAARRVPRRGER